MKIYVSHSSNFDYENELYSPIRESGLMRVHEFIFPHESEIANTHQTIQDADCVLAEVSYPSTGQGIELGWASVYDVPIFLVARHDATVSGSVELITEHSLMRYEGDRELIEKLISFFPV